jgi:hypothetical protein
VQMFEVLFVKSNVASTQTIGSPQLHVCVTHQQFHAVNKKMLTADSVRYDMRTDHLCARARTHTHTLHANSTAKLTFT